MIKTFIFAFAFLCTPLLWADDAQDFDRAVQAYKAGDYETAFPMIKRLAEQGDAKAQNNLGVMYDQGRGVPQDYKEALKWYSKAAEQGDAKAQNNLGIMYDEGKGVAPDYVQAHMWYNLAGTQGDEMSTKNRDAVAEKMTREKIAEAQRLARRWMEKHKK